jgi:ubiquinone/menaquinone biosynthesis C-methylase UbiE
VHPEAIKTKYRGETAARYDAERASTAKWSREQAVMAAFFRQLPPESTVIDIPVGTGRFIEFYHSQSLRVTGIDISPDMLAQAELRAREKGSTIDLRIGDIRRIDVDDNTFDVAICFRFLNWLNAGDLKRVLAELARVSRTYIVFSLRYYTPLRDLRPLTSTGFVGILTQWRMRVRRRLRRWYRADSLTIHDKKSLRECLAETNLHVIADNLVEAGKDGTEYRVIVLKKG